MGQGVQTCNGSEEGKADKRAVRCHEETAVAKPADPESAECSGYNRQESDQELRGY